MTIRILLIGAACILLAGCSKLTQENYRKLKVGQSYDEVIAVLGKPDTCSDALFVKRCSWGNDTKSISINFMADKVVITTSKNIK